MGVMRLGRIWPTEDRPLTVEDLRRLPDDGNRYELVDGVLEVTPAPFVNHERVVSRLQYLLQSRCRTAWRCSVRSASTSRPTCTAFPTWW
jgi:Uma2 family endonuclease